MVLETLYGLFFAFALFCALMVVLSPHAVYSALFLVGTMNSIAGLFVLMNAELAAAFQIIVYTGAIMVLFLFVLMLLNIGRQQDPMQRNRGVRIAGIVFSIAFVAQMLVLLGQLADKVDLAGTYTFEGSAGASIARVGYVLQTHYIYAFGMTSVLLLVAMIGAVVMARRHLIQGTRDVTRND